MLQRQGIIGATIIKFVSNIVVHTAAYIISLGVKYIVTEVLEVINNGIGCLARTKKITGKIPRR